MCAFGAFCVDCEGSITCCPLVGKEERREGSTPIITAFKFVICDVACATKPLLISFRSLNSSA